MVLKEEEIENYSGGNFNLKGCIPSLKKGYWQELDYTPAGDAPKNFIALYEYSKDSGVRKSNPKTWSRYIAKVGHKWYPIESINEYLFNQIGEVLKLKMASSRLMMAGNQLRFLSKYFLNKNESLEHGAQIFAGYMADDQWVENVEQQGLARKFFTFQFAEAAIKQMFPKDFEPILVDFVRMLVFDALTGNNDRHFYNWGVIKHIENKKKPTFAPVYDSARGLFWNDSEAKLIKWNEQPKSLNEKIKKYAETSKPKIGWDSIDDLNHFDLINKIFSVNLQYKEVCTQLINQDNLEKTLKLLNNSFSKFYSSYRLELINKCLIYRFERLRIIVDNKGGNHVNLDK
jgi:hypothetical protein